MVGAHRIIVKNADASLLLLARNLVDVGHLLLVKHGDGACVLVAPATAPSVCDIAHTEPRAPATIAAMTYQGARSRLALHETKRFFSVSKIRLDDEGFATHVLWSEVDSRTNLDVGTPVVVPVADVVDALRDGAQVGVVFLPPHTHLPDQTLEVVARSDGRQTIALAKRPGIAPALLASLQDVAILGDNAQPKKTVFGFSSRPRIHAVHAVSKVGLDPDGRVTHVQWGRVDTAKNQWIGTEAVVPVADAVAALKAGDQVFALFATANGHLPGRQFTFVDYDDGRQTLAFQGPPIAGHEIHDMDRLPD